MYQQQQTSLKAAFKELTAEREVRLGSSVEFHGGQGRGRFLKAVFKELEAEHGKRSAEFIWPESEVWGMSGPPSAAAHLSWGGIP